MKERITRSIQRIAYRTLVPRISKEKIKSRKNSDTLFVLGSGSSVCSYSQDIWDHISKHDSIGFNMWILHEFIPTFYAAEPPRKVDDRRLFFQNLSLSPLNRTKTLMLFKENTDFYAFSNTIRKANGFSIRSNALRAESTAELKEKLITSLMEQAKEKSPRVFTQTASVDWMIFFAALMGYQKVVLCGIDLNNVHYFYEIDRDKIITRGQTPPESGQSGLSHKTNDPKRCHRGIPISDVIRVYQKLKGDVSVPEISVALKSSALYPQVPVYTWPKRH